VGVAVGTILLVVLVVGVVVRALGRTVRNRGEMRRAQALAEPGARLGLTLLPDAGLPDDLPPFELLNTGKNRRVSNVLRGSVSGTPVVVFDYDAYFDSAQTVFKSLHYFKDLARSTVACVKGSWLSLPEFVMEPSLRREFQEQETQVLKQVEDAKLGAAAKALMHLAEGLIVEPPGWDFPDRPDVNYRVRGSDESAVRALFTTPVLDYFRDHHSLIVEGRGDWLLLTIPWKLNQPAVFNQPSVQWQLGSTGSADDGRLPADRLETLVRAATATLDVFRTVASR
jgi:hypothetical protein